MSNQDFPYEVIEEYIRGGCSVIYKIKARDGFFDNFLEDGEKPVNLEYVLKTMTSTDNDPQNVQRFYMEHEFLRAYPHPNLVKVQEYFHDWHGMPAYVMEWVEGATWQEYWHERSALEDPQHFLDIFRQFGEVIDFIHKHKIIHRDLKPQNVLVSNKDELKLIDFGIMKVADMTLYTHRNTFMGSAYYVAPEGISGEPVGNTADIFSIGVMLYDLFTGMKPFQGHTLGETIYQRLAKKPEPPSQIADVPDGLDEIILKMLDRDPHQRQPNCALIVEQLEALFGSFEPAASVEQPVIDVLTKGPFLHAHFLGACESFLREKKALYLSGPDGSGKTTIVENLCARFVTDTLLHLDCRANGTEMEFMEMILRHLSVPISLNRDLSRWKEILGGALPGLLWPTSEQEQAFTQTTIITAFKQVLNTVPKTSIIVIEDLHEASPSLVDFIDELAQLVVTHSNPNLSLIVTTVMPVPSFGGMRTPFVVNFPDVLSLSDYLTGQFGGCQIPVSLTESLVEYSEKNVGKFVRLVQGFKESGRLSIVNGVLNLTNQGGGIGLDEDYGGATIPSVLCNFSPDEICHLEWIALCADGIDMNILATVTRFDIASLGATIEKANRHDLLEYQTSMTQGFRWKNKSVQHYLVSALTHEEQLKRYRILAKTIEAETKPYLPYSPPLWLILCRLYQQAGNDSQASDYAFKYARYCSQTANYEAIRNLLSQFIPLPAFQNNQEFWCMLALANRYTDVGQALYFAKKALKIAENLEVLALLSILEFADNNEARARVFVHKVFSNKSVESIAIHYGSELMPILMDLGELDNARTLLALLNNKLKGRDDLYATNTLLLAKIQFVQTHPKHLLQLVLELQEELLPQTQRLIQGYVCRAHIERFDYEMAVASLKSMNFDPASDLQYYREWLFLFLAFERINEVKQLSSSYQRHASENEKMKALDPLFQLVTAIILGDPKVYDLKYLLTSIATSRVEKSAWLTVLLPRAVPSCEKKTFDEWTNA